MRISAIVQSIIHLLVIRDPTDRESENRGLWYSNYDNVPVHCYFTQRPAAPPMKAEATVIRATTTMKIRIRRSRLLPLRGSADGRGA
jgi:hypothetical protein